jgi:glycosyltransferase involved in cell wall biosynthesis
MMEKISSQNPPKLISVALCTFNGQRYLREQLDSLVAQDWPNLEIIAVDDASTDSTPAILEEYARQHPMIKYTANTQNKGYLKNFEYAISMCKGQWIAPCDQDDIWLPQKLSVLAKELEDGNSLMAFSDSELINANGQVMDKKVSSLINLFSTDDLANLLEKNMASGHTMLFCRSLLSAALPFPDGSFHDWWLTCVAVTLKPIRYVDQCLVHYRQHANSVTDLSGQKSTHKKHPGFRAAELINKAQYYQSLSCIPGKTQPMLIELSKLWQAWQTQYISWRLAKLLWQHCAEMNAVSKKSIFHKKRAALSFFWGLKFKRLVQPARYGIVTQRKSKKA